MVNNKVLSEYQSTLPLPSETRKIASGPLYEPGRVIGILRAGEGSMNLWTRKCIRDTQELGFDTEDISKLLDEALETGRYIDSEWCDNGKGAWAACDSYSIRRNEWIEHAHKNMQCEYYIKFAIGKNGKLMLIISCHL